MRFGVIPLQECAKEILIFTDGIGDIFWYLRDYIRFC